MRKHLIIIIIIIIDEIEESRSLRDSYVMRNRRETFRFPAARKSAERKINGESVNYLSSCPMRDSIDGCGCRCSGSGMHRRASARRGRSYNWRDINENRRASAPATSRARRMNHAAGSPFSAMRHGRTPSARRTGTRWNRASIRQGERRLIIARETFARDRSFLPSPSLFLSNSVSFWNNFFCIEIGSLSG